MTAQEIALALACPSCGRNLLAAASWHGANWCRAAYLVKYIRDHAGSSTWELSQATGLGYDQTLKGMTKARELLAVKWTSEERGVDEGFRYRYFVDEACQPVLCPASRPADYGR
jgi:hypothetical protein